MQIQHIRIQNFKSLLDCRLDLAKFTCLIGLNGAGKSTVLQFIDFLGQQVRGDIDGWLKSRQWLKSDLKSQFSKKNNIEFHVRLLDDFQSSFIWKGSFNTRQLRCTSESIMMPSAELRVQEGQYDITDFSRNLRKAKAGRGNRDDRRSPIMFDYQGSLLSQLKESSLPEPIKNFKQFIGNIHSLDLLSPEQLRQRTRESGGTLGLGGRSLSAYLHELGPRRRYGLVKRLRQVYPSLQGINIKSLRSGWKQLEIHETYPAASGGKGPLFPQMTTQARHIADGVLRLIAVLAELETDHRFLLFDEIENGINPELVEFVLNALIEAPQQVLTTTHSPLILNYLDDDTAKKGVIYLYKTLEGDTRSIPFFSIPSLKEKLTVMGPGEAFVDTNLTKLAEEIQPLTPEEE